MASKVVALTDEASSKLDHCPMCGEQVSVAYPSEYPNAVVRWRTRVNCNCQLSMGWCIGDTLEECLADAVNKWNTRA